MKIGNIILKIILLVITIMLSHSLAFIIGEWIQQRASIVSFDFYIGSFPGYLDGLVVSYVFFSSFIFSILSNNIKSGIYWSLPGLLLLLLTGTLNPQLWLSLLLLALGLGLAWVILQIINKLNQKNT